MPTLSTESRRSAIALLLVLLPGAIAAVERHGYELDVAYTAEVFRNATGGLGTGTRYLDNLDLMLAIDLAEAWNVGTGKLFLHGLYNNGSTFSDELTGDLQVVSNIEAAEAIRLYEAWYEFGSDAWSIRTGLYDLNSEFDVNETGSLFLNSSHGIGAEFGQSGLNGPSIFPVTSLAVRAEWQAGLFAGRVAVLDGIPGDPGDASSNKVDLGGGDGALVTTELDISPTSDTRLWAGYWRYTRDFAEPFGVGRNDDNAGWYVGSEGSIEIAERTVSLFARYGRANGQLNVFDDYFGAGVSIEAPFAARPDDRIGLAVASAGAGDPYRDHLRRSGDLARDRETTLELTYRLSIHENVELQPDVQYVSNPAANGSIDDALALGVRVVFSY